MLWVFRIKFCMQFLSLPCVLHTLINPILSYIIILIYEPNVFVVHIPEFNSRLASQLLVSSVFTKMMCLYIKLGHDRILSHCFKFIIN